MKIGVLGVIASDWSDVTYERVRFAGELGFQGMGAHLTVPAHTVSDTTAQNVKNLIRDVGLDFLQVWGPYPCIISPDESIRRAGVEGARDLVRLAAKMGVPASGVRPTSLNPRGDWWAHPDNYKPETEDRLVQSLIEILEVAEDFGINIVLETHVTTTLHSAEAIDRVIRRTGSQCLKINLDPCNFMGDLPTALNPTPTIHHLFDTLGQYVDTVHLKDFYFEDRFVVHITETVIGTGHMDFDTVLQRAHQNDPNGYLIIEHLPLDLIPLAKRNLDAKLNALQFS